MWTGRKTGTRDQRSRKALALAVVSLLGSLAAAGFVIASQSPSDGIPDEVETAAPRVGDHGVYRVTIGGNGTMPADTDDRDPADRLLTHIGYQEAGSFHSLDSSGTWRTVDRIEEARRWVDRADPDDVDERGWTHDLASGTAQPVARTYHGLGSGGRASATIDTGIQPPEPLPQETMIGADDRYVERNHQTTFDTRTTLFCGHRHSAQGTPMDRHAVIVAHGACDGTTGLGKAAGYRFIFVGLDRIEGQDTLQYRSVDSNVATYLWLHPDLPVPLRIAMTSTQDTPIIVELESFMRGTTPLLADVDPDQPAVPVTLVPVSEWGPEPGEFPVPWALPDAHAAAETHPDGGPVRHFQQAHPDSIVVAAQNQRGIIEAQPERTFDRWEFILGDGADGLWVRVTRSYPSAPAASSPLQPVLAAGEEVAVVTDTVDGPFPRPDQLPDALPSPGSVHARLSAINESVAQAGGETYGFRHLCVDNCTQVVSYTTAGRDEVRRREPIVYVVTAVADERDANLLQVDGAGRSLRLNEMDTTFEQNRGFVDWDERGDSTGRAALGSTQGVQGAAWRLPTPEVGAFLTLVSLAIGILYRLWPFLKTIPIFSVLLRPMRGDILDNPVRRRIHDVVRDEPGIHYSALMRKVGHGNHVVRHHLDRLLAADMLVERQGGRYACYFPPGVADRRALDAAPVLKSGQASSVLRAILENPGTSGRELAVALGIAPGTVSYHAKRLEEAGLVEARADGRHRRFHPTGLATDALDVVGGAGAAA